MHHSYIDRFSQQASLVHRLDARVKLLAVLAYTVVLVSFDRYALVALAPLTVLPPAMLWLGNVPVTFALRRAAMLCPFVLLLTFWAAWYDRLPRELVLGPWTFAPPGGWITAANVLAKFVLGILAITALIATTPFAGLLEAMRRLGVPKLLVMTLAFLYRYVFVLIDEGLRVRRARDVRGGAGAGLRQRLAGVGGAIGSLLGRTMDRSQRVHVAMLARGYDGTPRSLNHLRLRPADAAFAGTVVVYLVLCRWYL